MDERQAKPDAEWDTDFSRFVSNHPNLFDFCNYHEVSYIIHVSLRNKIIYFEIPKNACSSIKTMLHRIELGLEDFEHASFSDIHDRSFSPLVSPLAIPAFGKLVRSKDFFCFCVIRDPVQRLLSGYVDKVVNNGQFHSEISAVTGLSKGKTPNFRSFIYWIATQRVSDMDLHWRPQSVLSHLRLFKDVRCYSMENLGALSKGLSQHLGVESVPLEHIAVHATSHQYDRESVMDDPFSMDIINAKYKDDLFIWSKVRRDGGAKGYVRVWLR